MEDIIINGMLVSSVLLIGSIFLSKSSSKFGLPILVMFMLVGVAVGTEGLGIVHFENYELTHSLSLIAICIIIFSGGLSTNWTDVKPVLRRGILLSTVGVFITASLLAAFSYFFFNVSIIESLLLGSILSSTDAAAVFSAFRDKNAQVQKNIRSILEFESGSNDPAAYFLVTLFLGFYTTEIPTTGNIVLEFITNPLIGLVMGFLISWGFKYVNDHIELDYVGLYPALTISCLFLNYSLTTQLGGNGFLAVYIFGIFLGNQKIVHKSPLITFFDGTSWLAQIGLFILLGILVFPSRVLQAAPIGIFISIFLLFVARPLAVYICLLRSKFTTKEKVFISWAGLKGATPIVFASFVVSPSQPATLIMFDIVFFTVLISALLQGGTLNLVARKLRLMYESVFDPAFPVDLDLIQKTKNGIKQYRLESGDYAIEKRIVDLNLPRGALILFIMRKGQFIIPVGSTVFEESDKVLLVTNDKADIELGIHCLKYDTTLADGDELIPLRS